jgi:hypothetical protein
MGMVSSGGVLRIGKKSRKRNPGVCQRLSLGISLIATLFFLNGCTGLLGRPGGNAEPGSLQLNPTAVSFGKVGLGKQSTQSVSITNPGKSKVTITQVSVSNPQFLLSTMALPLSLPAGQSTSLSVSVKPTATGNVTGTLSVVDDATITPHVLNLTATGVNPLAQISPSSSSVDFGSVSMGTQGTESLTITNAGGADLTISMLTLTGAEFAVGGITTPKTVGTGQTVTLTLTFLPTTTGSVSGSLAITSNDPATPTLSIALTGSGTNTQVSQLTANPASLSFGSVNTGSTAVKQIVLTNIGNAVVKISQISASGTGFSVSGVTVPATVSASQSVTLNVGFAPTTAASASGTVTVTSDAKGSPLTIVLSGTGVQAGLNVSPATFNFGSVVDGQTKSQTFSVTNTGSAPLTISQISVSGAGYTVNGLVAPATLAAGQSTSFSAEFAPTTAGSLSSTVSISSNAPNSPSKVTLTGTGVAASVTVTASPASLAFGSINAGTSSSKSVTVTNTGNTNVTISQITVSAKDVSTSGITTPLTLTPGQAKAMNVAFSPTSAESVIGNVTVMSSQGSSSVIAISGTGVQAGLLLTPTSVSFGSLPVGTANTQTVKISNSGTSVLTMSQVSVAGNGFSTGGLSLPVSLNPGASSTFNVQYLPASAGAVNGSVSIVSNAPNSPAALPLSGTGTTATQTLSFSTTNIGFGNVNTGGSATQTVTITNTGNSNVQISQIIISGTAFTLGGASVPVTLTPSQSTTLSVGFSPTSTGTASGTVKVTSNATGSPVTITISGTGVQSALHTVSLTWNASTSTVAGYNVYRSTVSGGGYSKLNSLPVGALSYTDANVQSAQTYYYVTTAVDSGGNESAYSNQAQAIIP